MQLPSLHEINQSFTQIHNQQDLDITYDTYLGKNGSITQYFKTIISLSPEEKKEIGSKLGLLKTAINQAYEQQTNYLKSQEINKQLSTELVDIHSIGKLRSQGHFHLLTQLRQEVEQICSHMGFAIEYGHEIVTKFENFESVNIPLTHPATEMHDTYYLTQQDEHGQNLVLRTHTSAMQQQIIKKYGGNFKCIIPGKTYRCESTDASHDTMFRQLEGLIVSEQISIPQFIGIMSQIFSELFKTQTHIRLRPSYFPFTEPSFEMDISCTPDQPELFKLSKETGRLELGGAGMIHPNVLHMAGLDPHKHNGFAFGMGLTRMCAIKHQIRDIRYLTNTDLRFIQSFPTR